MLLKSLGNFSFSAKRFSSDFGKGWAETQSVFCSFSKQPNLQQQQKRNCCHHYNTNFNEYFLFLWIYNGYHAAGHTEEAISVNHKNMFFSFNIDKFYQNFALAEVGALIFMLALKYIYAKRDGGLYLST